MKKYRYIAMLALAVSGFGCSDTVVEEVRDAGAVSFSVSGGRSGEWNDALPHTRSTSRAIGFVEGDKIGVFACYRTSDGANTDFTPNYMLNQLVTLGSGGSWSYSPVKYWPTNGSVDFWGYYPYDADHKEKDGQFVHECRTGFEPLYQANVKINASNGNLEVDNAGDKNNVSGIDGSRLRLGFFPMLNSTHFTVLAQEGLFDGAGTDGDEFKDCHFLLLDFRVWGFSKQATYSMTVKQWNEADAYYTQEDPLVMTTALKKENVAEKIPGYTHDEEAGFFMTDAFIVTEGAKPRHLFNSPAHFIPLAETIEGNEPMFEVQYVVLTKPEGTDEYRESGIVTRRGSLKEIFSGKGLIEKNININLKFTMDGVTVTRELVDYIYKPMF